MMEQPEPEQPRKCPYVEVDTMNAYLVCKASNWSKKTPMDDTPAYRPITREEIALCCSLSHLECPDFKKMKKLEAQKEKEARK
jgi:hypothetical protein